MEGATLSYNGSGTFSLAAGNPVVTGTAISSTWANGTLSDIATGLTTALCKDGQSTPTANLPMGGFKFTGLGAGTASGNSLRYEQVNGAVTTAGDLLYASAAGVLVRIGIGTVGQALLTNSGATAPVWGVPVIRSYLAGLTLSTAGASATMSIAAGTCADSTNASMMALTATSKTTSAWAVGSGNGGLDTGSISTSTWYHFYVIQRVDTGVVDLVFSTSASAPTLPTNYTLYRRIGSMITNGSSQWTSFIQDGDLFQYSIPGNRFSTANPGTSAVTANAATPLGIRVNAWMNANLNNATTNNIVVYVSDLSVTDSVPSAGTFCSLQSSAGTATAVASADVYVMTSASQTFRYRLSASGASDTLAMSIKGWVDHRGRDV